MKTYAYFMHAPGDWRITKRGFVMRNNEGKPYTFKTPQDAERTCNELNRGESDG